MVIEPRLTCSALPNASPNQLYDASTLATGQFPFYITHSVFKTYSYSSPDPTMLAIQDASEKRKYTPNILPCRVHYTGPTKVTKRFWTPSLEQNGSLTSHFRGRRLRGKAIKLYPGYQGYVMKKSDRQLPQPAPQEPRYITSDEDDELQILDEPEEEETEPVKILERVGAFDEMIVWGHDQVPAADDPFVRGVEEWIAFAEAIHRTDDSSNSGSGPGSTSQDSKG